MSLVPSTENLYNSVAHYGADDKDKDDHNAGTNPNVTMSQQTILDKKKQPSMAS